MEKRVTMLEVGELKGLAPTGLKVELLRDGGNSGLP